MSISSVLAHPAGIDPDIYPVTRLAVAWQHVGTRHIHPVGVLEQTIDGYRFRYIANALDLEGFRPLLGFPDLRQSYESHSLFPLFAERVMDPRRPDRERFLDALDLRHNASPFEILAVSNGRRMGDTIQLFPEPTVDLDGTTQCRFLVHGIRHIAERAPGASERLLRLRVGDRLDLVNEPSNTVNARAILTTDSEHGSLGYVPDMLLDYVHTVRDTGPVSVAVAHVNGPEAPSHLRLLGRFEGRAPLGYRPFSGAGWDYLA